MKCCKLSQLKTNEVVVKWTLKTMRPFSIIFTLIIIGADTINLATGSGHSIGAVLEGVVRRVLSREDALCYSAAVLTEDSESDLKEALFEAYFPILGGLTHQKYYHCSDHVVIVVKGSRGFNRRNLTRFRMYFIVNLAENEEPGDIRLNNVVWLQKLSVKNCFAIYEKKRGKMEKTSIWNGAHFLDAVTKKRSDDFKRSVKRDIMRVGSAIYPPHTEFRTDDAGRLIKGAGVEVRWTRRWRTVKSHTVSAGFNEFGLNESSRFNELVFDSKKFFTS